MLVATPLVIGLNPGQANALQGTIQSTTSPMGQTNGQVDAIVYANGAVYVAGSFTSVRPSGAAAGVGEQARQSMAGFNSTTGAITAFKHTFKGAVKTIAVAPDASRIYVGGAFTTVDGQPRQRLAAFQTSNGALVAGWAPNAGSTVNALGVGPDGAVYIGGSFGKINNVNRLRLAAVRGDNGALLPWVATADAATYSIAVAGGKVFVGGTFERLNDDPTYRAVGTLDAVTGAIVPFPSEWVMPERTPECYSVVKDIVTAGGVAYFATEGTGGGCMDGTFAANVSDGSLKWVNHCLGAAQSVEVVGGWLYKGSHSHDCQSQVPDDPDGFPQVPVNQGYHLLVQNLDTGHLGPWYPNTSGNPLGPRAMATDGTQLFVAGDFRNVNNKGQQGVARFSPGADTTPPPKPAAPVAVSGGPGQVSVYVQAPFDQDDPDLTMRLYRDGGTTPVATADVHSLNWRRPVVGFSDPGLVPGSVHSYRVDAIERFDTNKSVLSNATTVTVASSSSSYAGVVAADNPSLHWRLGEPSGTIAADSSPNLRAGTFAGTRAAGQAGAIIGDSNTAVTMDGSTGVAGAAASVAKPDTFSAEAWFKTTTTSGGKIFGFGNTSTTNSSQYDKHVYMTNDGRLTFGVYNGGFDTINTPSAYNDGQWHHVVATQGSAGMALYLDGVRVGKNPVTTSENYTGYWRIGGDNLNAWPNQPSSSAFAGSIDEFAVYGTALSKIRVVDHFVASGRPAPVSNVPSDAYGGLVYNDLPEFFWRLGEAGGPVAADASGNDSSGTYGSAVTFGQAGAVAGTTDTAVGTSGDENGLVSGQGVGSPTEYSAEAWIKTTTTSGGKIIGFGNSPTGYSSAYDKHVYMTNGGQLIFGVWVGHPAIAQSSAAYNDGEWHHVLATQGPGGLSLYVDGALVGSDPETTNQSYGGYWRVGGDNINGWPSQPSSAFFQGDIDEAAVYPTALSPSQVAAHWTAGS